jgi:hypothetical protein
MEFLDTNVTYRAVERLPNGVNYSIPMSQVFNDYWYIFVGSAALYLPAVYYGKPLLAIEDL